MMPHRYKGLTPDEMDAKMAEDKITLEQTNRHLEALKSARGLDVDIDALEDAGFTVAVSKWNRWIDTIIDNDGDIVLIAGEFKQRHLSFVSFKIFASRRRMYVRTGGYKVCGRIGSNHTVNNVSKISVSGYKNERRDMHTIICDYNPREDGLLSCLRVEKIIEHRQDADDEPYIYTGLLSHP